MLFAEGRHTVASWFAAAGVRDDWAPFYDCLLSIERLDVYRQSIAYVSRSFDASSSGFMPVGRRSLASVPYTHVLENSTKRTWSIQTVRF